MSNYLTSVYTRDSQHPSMWSINNLGELIRTDIVTGDPLETIENVFGNKIVSNMFNGDLYIFKNKTTVNNSNLYTGDVFYYSRVNSQIYDINLTLNNNVEETFAPMDAVFDYASNRLWVADTFNHRILAINVNTNEIVYVFERSNYIFPCSLTFDASTNTIFARMFYSNTLEEVIVIIKNQTLLSIFSSPGLMGMKNIFMYYNDNLLVLNNTINNPKIYNIFGSGSIGEIYNVDNLSAQKMSYEPLNGTIATYSSSEVQGLSIDGDSLGNIPIAVDMMLEPFVSPFGGTHWAFTIIDGVHYLVNIQIRGSNNNIIKYGSAQINRPTCGTVVASELSPVILYNDGYSILKTSRDANTIETTSNLSNAFNLIDSHIKYNTIIIAKSDKKYISILNSELVANNDYTIVEDIKDVVFDQYSNNYFWLLCSGNLIKKMQYVGAILTTVGSVTISTSDECLGIKYDFVNKGVFCYTDKKVFKISDSGNIVQWTSDTINNIYDVSQKIDFTKLYDNNYNTLYSSTMVFDQFRNNLWWLTQGSTQKICCLNTQNNSIKYMDLEKVFIDIISEYVDEYVSINLVLDNGELILMAKTTSGRFAMFIVDKYAETLTFSKLMPIDMTSGEILINQNLDGEVPFSFYTLQPENNNAQLTLSYDVSKNNLFEFDVNKFLTGAEQQDVLPNNVIVPNKIDLVTASNEIQTYTSIKDNAGIRGLKISPTSQNDFELFNKENNAFITPQFTWQHNSVDMYPRFVISDTSNNMYLTEYDDSSKSIMSIADISSNNNPLGNETCTSLYYVNKRGYCMASFEDSLLKINTSSLSIDKITYNLKDIIITTQDGNGNLWGGVNNYNLFKLNFISENQTTYSQNFSYIKKAISIDDYLLIMSPSIIYKFNSTTQVNQIINSTDDHHAFSDICIDNKNNLAIASVSKENSYDSIINIYDSNINVTQSIPLGYKIQNIIFDNKGNLLVLAEKNSILSFLVLDIKNSQISFSYEIGTGINSVNIFEEKTLNCFFVGLSNGWILQIKQNSTTWTVERITNKIAKNIKFITLCNPGVYKKETGQIGVRVFVGSEMMLSDRWDSGEIKSNKTSILYGGGNNLEPGQKYFVHISIDYKNKGWSDVQVKEFIMPK